MGCKGNPLNEDYHTLGRLATEGWVKAVWERALHYRFTITLDYPMQDPPWERDRNLVEIFLENGKTGSELCSINKCRISHQAIYLSCLSTAEGKNLDPIYLLPPQVNEKMSFHQFGSEESTRQDWASWEAFWRGYCRRFLEFLLPLGDWKIPGHRIWPWLIDTRRDVVYHQNYHKFHAYIPLVKRTTRSGSLYILLGEVNVVPIMVVPITVSKVEEDVVVVKGDGPCLPRLQPIRLLFWEAMQAEGGHWMWDYVSDKESDPLWLKEALEQGSAILATDGSYLRTKGPHISRAGWVIACRKTHRLLKGLFYENSRDASPYRGKLLGLVALHTIILQICKYYNLQSVRGKIICDSKSALNLSSKQYRRVSAGTPQADLF